ncbi:osmotically inducible lipoprotein OsmB [Mesorhizobium soli]|jgi:osmotically inducible lipoprotein OsmB|uniref:glycine zipper domain-containing protein n=1 Tax=Pseudaminobacter soli (ex Li et al. 2025) TaxID=1295366 RepID=UPI0024756221|nr:glycine zipper domain-containing protein [Mesorhizobium soli]MDH6230409.1 osmotically inducible lipoprotein OsmB [Mesorhizobium soli]
MKIRLSLAAALALTTLALAGCNTPGERAVGGGAIGAGVGALAGQAIGGNTGSTVAGALIGGAAGAAIGASTAPNMCVYQQFDKRGRPLYDRYGNPRTYQAPCR